MNTPSIRRAAPADHDAVVALVRRFYEADPHPFDAGVVTAGLTPLLEDDRHGTVLVAEDDDGLVGYGVLTWGWSIEGGGREGLVDELFALEQGRGHGTWLLRALLREAAEQGCTRVFLETEAANDAARRFYRRHGFGAEDSVWMVHELG